MNKLHVNDVQKSINRFGFKILTYFNENFIELFTNDQLHTSLIKLVYTNVICHLDLYIYIFEKGM